MLESKYKVWLVFLAIVTIHLVFNNTLQLHYDEAYYWVWSKHLQLSYFDHPPMVAYFIKITTSLFGDNPWAIRLAAASATSGACFIIYLLVKRAFGLRAANISVLLFMAWPISEGCFFISTIDAPLLLFFSLTLYCYYRGVVSEEIIFIYYGGVALGLALLSKYIAVLILPALFIYILTTKTKRYLLATIHPYLSILVALAVFSPVIIWNYTHEWVSFTFQYIHGTGNAKHFNILTFMDYWGSLIGANNPFMTIPFIALLIIHRADIRDERIKFFVYNLATVVLIFAWSSRKSFSEANWAAIGILSMIILLSYFYSKFRSNKLIAIALIPIFILVPVLKTPELVLPNKYLHLIPGINAFTGNHELLDVLDKTYLQKYPNAVLISCSYADASWASFYLHKQVYVPSNFPYSHTFSNWNDIIYSKISSALYLCSEDGKNDPTKLHELFTSVVKLPSVEFENDYAKHHFNVYLLGN